MSPHSGAESTSAFQTVDPKDPVGQGTQKGNENADDQPERSPPRVPFPKQGMPPSGSGDQDREKDNQEENRVHGKNIALDRGEQGELRVED